MNYNRTKLSCSDPRMLQRIIGKCELKSYDGTVQIEKDAAHLMTRGLPHTTLLKISRANKDLIFTAEYSFDCENYATTYVVKYKNGRSRQVAVIDNALAYLETNIV